MSRIEIKNVNRNLMGDTFHVTSLTLDLEKVAHNLKIIRDRVRAEGVIAVVKGFGYGTNAPALSKLLEREGVKFFAVAYVDEGVRLRKSGVKTRIIVMNPAPITFDDLNKYSLEPTIISLEHLKKYLIWKSNNPEALDQIHLNFDSGMHRLGFDPRDISEIARLLIPLENLNIATVYTHLAGAESSDQDPYTIQQFNNFDLLCSTLRDSLKGHLHLSGFKTHALNSSGVSRFPDKNYDLVRVGIALFGTELSNSDWGLIPAVTFGTVISLVRTIPPGEGLSYGLTDSAPHERTIAWIPVGYADGYPRSLGGGVGEVLVTSSACASDSSPSSFRPNTVGRICMDLTAIDVTGHNVRAGDSVELFGTTITLQEVAHAAGTLPYELLARIHERVVRI